MVQCSNATRISKYYISRRVNEHRTEGETEMKISNEDVFNDLDFSELINFDKYNSAPKSIGVYVLYNKSNQVIYVGKSVNLKKRLYEHFKGFKDDEKSRGIREETQFFAYCEIPLTFELDIYETILINYFKPIYNVDKLYDNRGSSVPRIMKVKKDVEIRDFSLSLEEFLINFFRVNKGVEVGLHTLRMVCENNGFDSNVVGTCFSLCQLKESGIVYENGKFKYKRRAA